MLMILIQLQAYYKTSATKEECGHNPVGEENLLLQIICTI